MKKSKADKRRQKHIKAQAKTSEFTPAQKLMQRELFPPIQAVLAQDIDRQVLNPVPIGQILTEEIGVMGTNPIVSDLAHKLMDEHMEGFVGSLGDWAKIQRTVESAINAGYAWAIEDEKAN